MIPDLPPMERPELPRLERMPDPPRLVRPTDLVRRPLISYSPEQIARLNQVVAELNAKLVAAYRVFLERVSLAAAVLAPVLAAVRVGAIPETVPIGDVAYSTDLPGYYWRCLALPGIPPLDLCEPCRADLKGEL